MPKLERIYDLAFEVMPDGSIELEQGFAEVQRISLHACHVRHLLERAGHLLPPPPADELSKRMARELREVLSELCDEYGRSPGIDRVIDRLSAVVDMLPDFLFQQDKDKQEASDRPAFQLTHPTKKEKP